MRSRRGLSSIVGAVFALIALSIMVGYVSYSLGILDQYNQAVMSRTQVQLAQQKESYSIVQAPIVNSKFNITVSNTGPLPVNVTKIWIRNVTAYTAGVDWTHSYNITNTLMSPGAIAKNIGQNIAFTALPTKSYDVRIITSRGNTQEMYVNSVGSQPVLTQLTVFPQVAAPSYDVTLLYTVTNNMSSNTILTNIQPSALTVTPSGTGAATLVSGPTPTQISNLKPGATAVFKWVYLVTGVGGDTIAFTASLQNGASTTPSSDIVTLQDILFASQSKTSESSLGVNWTPSANNILVEHQETAGTPSSKYQMFSGVNDAGGTTLTLLGNNPQITNTMFYTANDSAHTITIPTGKWNAVFRYNSVDMPTSLQSHLPDIIYYFGNGAQLKDSSGNADDLTANGGPSYSSSCTRDGSGCYSFVGTSQYLSAPDQSYNVGNTNPRSTAGWFKVSSLPTTSGREGTIFDIDGGAGVDFYKISIQKSGKLRFAFSTANDGHTSSNAAICDSAASTYGDGNWHFFVAVRDTSVNANSCKLYVDAAAAVSASANLGTNSIDDGGNGIRIGRNNTEATAGSSYFTGSIDYIMHWNNYQFTAADVSALYSKNYGTAAHTLHINIDKTDINGNLITRLNTTNNNFPVSFYDNGYSGASAWGKVNYTIPNLASVTFNPNERLRLNVTSTSSHPESLDMQWRIDDKTLVDFYPGYTSFIQIPTPTPGFLSYYTYSISSGTLTYTGLNQGPNGMWLNAGTRVVFQSTAGGTCTPTTPTTACSFSGVISAVNGTTNIGYIPSGNTQQDSLYIPLNKKYTVTFAQPNTVPATPTPSASTKIVAGTYKMSVSIVGYDDTGANVFKTISIGNVNVIP